MLNKKIWGFILVVFSVLFIAACSMGESDDDNLELITGDPDGTWASIGTGISDKLNDKLDDTEISSKPGSGSVGNPEAIANEKGDIGMSYNPFLLKAQNGEDPFDKEMDNLKAVASLS